MNMSCATSYCIIFSLATETSINWMTCFKKETGGWSVILCLKLARPIAVVRDIVVSHDRIASEFYDGRTDKSFVDDLAHKRVD